MSEAWGRTGRVTLLGDATEGARDGQTSDLVVDGKKVGWIGAPDFRSRWWAFEGYAVVGPRNLDVPTRDAAVMWVLRRTAPDVWRAERPVVWQVRHPYRGETYAFFPWHVRRPDGRRHSVWFNHADALDAALKNVHVDAARAAR